MAGGYVTPPSFGFGLPAASTDLGILAQDIVDLDARTTPFVGTDGSIRPITSSSYVSSGTAATSAPIGANGLALVLLYSSLQGDTVGALVLASYRISGAFSYGPLDSDSITYQVPLVNFSDRKSGVHVASIGSVSPGSPRRMCTFEMMYKVSSGNANVEDSRIVVIPLGS